MTRRPLKIAFIGGRGIGNTYSGIETYYEEVGARLAARGHSVTAYCRSYFTPDVDSFRGIRVRRLSSIRTKHLDTLTHSLACTVETLWQRYDIVQYHAIGSAPLSFLPRLWGSTTVLSVRGLDWQRAKWMRGARLFLQFGEWASARCPTATVVVSQTLQNHYEKKHGRRPTFISNAKIESDYRPPQRMSAFGLERDRYVLFAGRLSPEKGIHTLLEAYGRTKTTMPLVIAGGSSQTGDYIDSLHAAQCGDVRFIGNVDHETMEELYSNCYVYVLPSVMEGLSVGLLEAVGHGQCIVTTAIPENVEVVGDSALLFSPGDEEGLASVLQNLFDSPELVELHRQRARARAASLPGWDEVASDTERFYLELIEGPKRTTSMSVVR